MFEDILLELYRKFWTGKNNFINRDIAINVVSGNSSYLLIGPRRAGKSTLLYEICDLLVEKGLSKEDFIFINFEAPKLVNFKSENLDSILLTYNSIHPNKKPILLLDEIQHIDNWERYVRNLVDNQYRVFVTGSNSRMLNANSRSLRGARFIEKKVLPLNFECFLYFKGFTKRDVLIQPNAKIINLFREYLQYGGFPEVVLSNKKEDILTSYFELGVSDVLKTNSDFNELEIKLLLKKIRENIKSEVTINSYNSFFKSIDYKIDKNKVYNYFQVFEDNFLVLSLSQYRKSLRTRSFGKKMYFIDNGYVSLFDVKEDFGLKLENLIFLELYATGRKIYYYKNDLECDFVVCENDKVKECIQVTYELTDKDKSREVNGLLNAITDLNLNSGVILTYNQEQIIKQDKKTIYVKPVWKWLLGKK